jgi:hypothetical protein
MRHVLALTLVTGLAALVTASDPSEKEKGPKDLPRVNGKTLKEWRAALKPDPIKEVNLDASRRAFAITSITQFDDPREAVPDLLDRMAHDVDTSPRLRALMALRTIDIDDKDVPRVIKALCDRFTIVTKDRVASRKEAQATIRYEVLVTLQRFLPDLVGTEGALAGIISETTDGGSWEIRQLAVHLLWRAGVADRKRKDKSGPPNKEVVTALLDALGKEAGNTWLVRLEALMGLASLGGAPAEPELRTRMSDVLNACASSGSGKGPDVSKAHAIWACAALSHLGSETGSTKDPLKVVTDHLKAPLVETRLHALAALGALGKAASSQVPKILPLLESEEMAVAQSAMSALGSIGDKSSAVTGKLLRVATPPMKPTRDELTRAAAALQTLAAMGASSPDVIKELEALDKNPRIDRDLGAVARSARALLLEKKEEEQEKIKQQMAYNLSALALRLAKERTEGSVKPTVDKVGDKTLKEWMAELDPKAYDASIRARAVVAIMQFEKGGADAIPALLRVLRDDPDVSPRTKVVVALRTMEIHEKHVDAVISALADRLRIVSPPPPAAPYRKERQATIRFEVLATLGRFTEDITSVKPASPTKDLPAVQPATPAIISATRDNSSWEIRQAALSLLWRSALADKNKSTDGPDKSIVKAALDSLETKTNTDQVRLEALMGLAALGKPQGDPDLERRLIKALSGYTGAPRLGHTDATRVRAIWALAALAHLGDNFENVKAPMDQIVRFTGAFLPDKKTPRSLAVRAQAITALGTLGNTASKHVPQLLSLVDDPEPLIMQAACSAIVMIGDRSDKAMDKVVDKLATLIVPKDLDEDKKDNRHSTRSAVAIQTLMALDANRGKVHEALEALKRNDKANSGLRDLARIAIDHFNKKPDPKKDKKDKKDKMDPKKK